MLIQMIISFVCTEKHYKSESHDEGHDKMFTVLIIKTKNKQLDYFIFFFVVKLAFFHKFLDV
jgi:hypothetical protein